MLLSNLEIDQDAFTQSCLDAARDFGTSVFYLIAVAYTESGLKNIAAAGGSAFGPFQILEATWNAYISSDPTLGLKPEDRFDPYMQAGVAAVIAVKGAAALMAILPDNRIPTYQELYFTHLFGEAGAKIILAGDLNRSIQTALEEVYAGPKAGDSASAIINANKSLMTNQAGPLSISALLAVVGSHLDAGLTVALTLLRSVEPDLGSGASVAKDPRDQKDTPWMKVAKAELAKNISEGNPRIRLYLQTTTLAPIPPGHVPWCAAFVSFCTFNSAGTLNGAQQSARAEDWLAVGTKLPGPQYGAIAVLEPLVAGSSGHVGFVSSWDGQTVKLLAGNQTPPAGSTHAVCEKNFGILHVRGWRLP